MYGMMPRPKIVIRRRSAALNTETCSHECEQAAVLLARCMFSASCCLVDDRQRNLIADAKDGQQDQREEDLLPQLGNREDRAEFFPHGELPVLEYELPQRQSAGKACRASPDYQNRRSRGHADCWSAEAAHGWARWPSWVFAFDGLLAISRPCFAAFLAPAFRRPVVLPGTIGGRAARLFDLFLGRRAEAMGRNRQLLGQLAVAQHLQHVEPPLEDAASPAGSAGVTSAPASNSSSRSPTLTSATVSGEDVREAALGNAADQGRAAALEDRQRLPAGAGDLALVAAARRLALAGADAAADAAAASCACECLD